MLSNVIRLTLLMSVFIGIGFPNAAFSLTWKSPPDQFTTDGAGQYQDLASDPAGNAITIWTDSMLPGVQASYFSASIGAYGAPVTVFSGDAIEVQIAMDATGNALAIWAQGEAAIPKMASFRR